MAHKPVEVHGSDAAVLKENQEVLDRGGARSLSFGQMALQIPMSHRVALGRKYPDLDSPDQTIQLKAWQKFIKSAESKPYRVSAPKYGLRQP